MEASVLLQSVQHLSAPCHDLDCAAHDLHNHRPVQANQLVIRQADLGDHFYIVSSGVFDVYLQPVSLCGRPALFWKGKALSGSVRAPARGVLLCSALCCIVPLFPPTMFSCPPAYLAELKAPSMMPELVHTYLGSELPLGAASASASSPGHAAATAASEVPASFGELALMYSKARAATVLARCAGDLLSLARDDLRAAIQVRRGRMDFQHMGVWPRWHLTLKNMLPYLDVFESHAVVLKLMALCMSVSVC
jgi:CRP-like cAMP-binding protein